MVQNKFKLTPFVTQAFI